jgi:ubiquinone/menaquinone biosynthesis C-methylase UbiE
MLKEDVENYFSEIARVLKPKGRCAISCFLLNKYSLEMIEAKKSVFNFQYVIDGGRTVNCEVPESAVAYDEETMRGLFAKNKLSIIEPIHFGWWSNGKPTSSSTLQDMIVAIK